jgi:predicted ATPase
VTALLQPAPPATILVDEPELGLHPAALEALAGMMREASNKTQVIVSTQSATLLDLFEPSEVVVVDRVNGASTFTRLEEEMLREWLEEFTLGDIWRKNAFKGGPYDA